MTFRAFRVVVSISRKHATRREEVAARTGRSCSKSCNPESRNGHTKEKGYGSVRASDTEEETEGEKDAIQKRDELPYATRENKLTI